MQSVTLNGVKIIPSKVVCVGRNYVEHIQELNNEVPTSMVLFAKPNSAVSKLLTIDPKVPLHYEGEISFLVKDGAIFAVGFGLDLTNRGLQSELKAKGLPWERAKAFDGAAVMSSFVSIDPSLINSLSMQLWINDTLVQEGGVSLMIYKPETIIEEIQSFMTLEDYDIIMTGTPKGVGSFKTGDCFIGKIFLDGTEILSHAWCAQAK